MTLPLVLDEVRKRPGMFLPVATYEAGVAFVLGYNAAMDGGLLQAFREWLITKLGHGNSLSWPALVVEVIGKQQSSATLVGLQTADDHRAAIDALFATIEEFLDERDAPGGARRIYAAYERWLGHQDWYGPSSPDWLPKTSP